MYTMFRLYQQMSSVVTIDWQTGFVGHLYSDVSGSGRCRIWSQGFIQV